jgi:hypothetical protein
LIDRSRGGRYEELDTGAEFFYNESTQTLYVIPNATKSDDGATAAPPAELHDLVVRESKLAT